MFGLLKKDKKKKLRQQYEKLMKDYHRLSTVNRAESDKKYAEAQKIAQELDALDKKS